MNLNFKTPEKFFALTSRILLAAIFILSGLNKTQNYAGTQGYMDAMGVPSAVLPLVIALEIIGGVLLVIGYKIKPIAFLLGGFCLATALLFHFDLQDQNQFIHFFKNIAMAGGFFAILANGSSAVSLDTRMNK